MSRWQFWLLCIGKAVRANGLKAIASLIPMGDALYEIAKDAWMRLREKQSEAEIREGLGELAATPDTDIECEAQKVVQKVAGDQSPEIQLQLVTYLRQVPNSIRASLSRPADPAGRTVPGNFRLDRPEGLLSLLPSRLPRFRPGDRPPGIGDWELVRLLGAGGFGEVWLARNPHLPTPVALKFCLDPTAAQYLRHEAALLGRVVAQGKHPGIVALQHTYLSADPPCLEYEYVAGGQLTGLLSQWHAKSTPDLVQQSLGLLRELADVVAFAHRLQPPIVHRDLKPANILLQRMPDGRIRLRVTDFGIGGVAVNKARDLQKSASQTRGDLLVTSLRGSHTLLYASPEQMRGDPPDPRDDVHALGVIWLQLLTGDVNRGVTGDWRDELSDRKIPESVIGVMRRCVTSNLDRRLASAAELVSELDKLLAGFPTATAPTPPIVYPAAAAPTAAPAKANTVPHPTPPGPPQPPKDAVGRFLGVAVMLAALVVLGWFVWPKLRAVLPILDSGASSTASAGNPLTNSIGMKLVLVPAGQFTMGTPTEESYRQEDEGPQHEVQISQPFYMGAYEVTQREFGLVMSPNPSIFDSQNGGGPDHPVENVTWHQASEFCRKLSEREDEGRQRHVYSLPTEAQWEYAARAGQRGEPFAFGTKLASTQANFDGQFPYGGAAAGPKLKKTCSVGRYDPNAWGLHDMHGNVAEWCLDLYGPYAAKGGVQKDPTGSTKGPYRVVRGGSWSYSGGGCRSGARLRLQPDQHDKEIGFRVVMTLNKAP